MTDIEAEDQRYLRPLPFRVRPRHLETLRSFATRYREANFDTVREAHLYDRKWLTETCQRARVDIARFNRGRPAELRHPDGSHCEACDLGTGDQWLCRLCSHGAKVKLDPHLERVVCTRHGIWVGSGAKPSEQVGVGSDFVAAERIFQRLRRKGLVTAAMLMEMSWIVDPDAFTEDDTTTLPMNTFPLAMRIWSRLTDHGLLRQVLDPTKTYAEAYRVLCESLTSEVGGNETIVQRVWFLIRPLALRVRASLDATAEYTEAPHDLRTGNWHAHTRHRPIAPLEPFERYLDAVHTTITYENWRGIATPAFPGLSNRSFRRLFQANTRRICAKGHSLAGGILRGTGELPCGKCAGNVVVPGVTDFAATRPALVPWFDTAKNAPLTVEGFFPTTVERIHWRCLDLGHAFIRTAAGFCKTPRCPVCEDRELLTGYNSLKDRLPKLATEISRAHGQKPASEILWCSDEMVWWDCPNGHNPYQDSPRHRVRHQTGCTLCTPNPYKAKSKRKRQSLTATWAERHPILMKEWDIDRNGTTADTAIDATIPRWYTCIANGHSVKSTVSNRVLTRGCTSCPKSARIGFGLAPEAL